MTRSEHASRPRRESLGKRLGRVARAIRARDGHRCQYCGATEARSGAPLHLDHLTTRHAGGADAAANLVVACRRCNTARQDRTLSAWCAYAEVTLGLTISARAIRAQARRRLPEAA